MREDGKMMVQPYKYLSPQNKVHFLLYLAKDLPNRALTQVSWHVCVWECEYMCVIGKQTGENVGST